MNIVQAAVIHRLEKAPRGGKSVVTRRDALNTLDDKVTQLVLDINDLYAKKSNKGYGRFRADEAAYPTSRLLRGLYTAHDRGLLAVSHELLDVLAARADRQPLAKGGYVLMAQVGAQDGARWFLVALINNVAGSAVDENLEVIETLRVDLDHLRVVGRVDIRGWLEVEGHSRYVGFLKPRGDVAEYFKAFLGCDDLVVPAVETRSLAAALKSFAAEHKLDVRQEEEFMRAAFNYCDQRAEAREPLSLEALANAAWPHDGDQLKARFARDGAQVSDGFVPDRSGLRPLLRIRARTPAWSVEVDLAAFSTGDAFYLRERQGLLLCNLPRELLDELERETLSDA